MLGRDITLERMTPLMAALGNPEAKLKIIHVAGTSGKTSTAYYVASLLQQTGKKVGLTVSPHVDSVTERVQINMEPLAETEFCRALSEFIELIQNVEPQPTYFELLIAFVYWYFAKANVDYAVIETGLGGLHDASNVARRTDKVCVITDIGYDHTHVLGHSLLEISAQKAGIIHAGNQVFMYKQAAEIMNVFSQQADAHQATLNVLSNGLIDKNKFVQMPAYQQRNWLLARHAFEYIRVRDGLPALTDAQLKTSQHVKVPGRMDIKQVGDKTLIMDGAHNQQKMGAFVESFKQLYPDKKTAILMSLKEDKEYKVVLPLIEPICSRLIITKFLVAQDLPAKPIGPEVIAKEANRLGFDNITQLTNLSRAYQMLLEAPEDIMIVTGSFYLISNLRSLIKNIV